MRFVIYGAGAVGGVVAARLAQHGHEVAVIARGPHLDAIRANGLRIQSPDDDTVVPVAAFDQPGAADLGRDDVVLVGTKSQDSASVIAALVETAPAEIPVVSLQNGVANEPAYLRWFPNVYGICVMAPTAHIEPGIVQAMSSPIAGLLDIGRYPAGVDDTATAVATALSGSSCESIARPDIMRWKYRKLLMNLGNAVDATCARDDDAATLRKLIGAEGTACLDAAGIPHVSREEDRERRGNLLTVGRIAGRDRGGGSTFQSLARGTGAVEVDYLNGEIVWLGRQHGVPTPANELVRRVANEMARAGVPPRSVTARTLLDQL
jgi:2-dehydropantoate 2-reductase